MTVSIEYGFCKEPETLVCLTYEIYAILCPNNYHFLYKKPLQKFIRFSLSALAVFLTSIS